MPTRKTNPTNPKVDFFFRKAERWQAEYELLRGIALECPVTEELKWGVPCYTFDGKNIVMIHGFKEYCAILFPKGVLLKDPEGVLIIQTQNVQSARQIRFASVKDITKLKSVIKAYIHEAIQVEVTGLKVEFKKPSEFAMPEEFVRKLEETRGLQDAFEALTPGRQRAYLLYFAAPKLSKTRTARIENYVEHILSGKGLND